MVEKLNSEQVEFLFRALKSLKTTEEYYAFFDDVCTISEITEISRRLEAARLLAENTVYSEIADRTGLSTATISRVNRCLKYGRGGYTTVLKRLGIIKNEE